MIYKLILIFFQLIIITGYGQNDSTQINNNCPEVSYNTYFAVPFHLISYYDYYEGLQCARNSHKPYLIYFSAHNSIEARYFEMNNFKSKKVQHLLKQKFVMATLYLDDKSKLLKKHWIINKMTNDTIKIYGEKQRYIQNIIFNDQKYPVLYIIDENEKQICKPFYYNAPKETFIEFLEKGIKKYNN